MTEDRAGVTRCIFCHEYFDSGKQRVVCPHHAFGSVVPVTELPKPEPAERKLRITTVNGNFFDMDLLPDFNMFTFMTNIKAAGFLLTEAVYVPLDMVECVFVYNADKPPQRGEGVVLPFPPPKGAS